VVNAFSHPIRILISEHLRHSVEFLKPHLSDAAKYDTNSPNTLTAAFHSLIQSLLELFVNEPIATPQLVVFFQRLLDTLPSSSDPSPGSKPRPEAVIGELLVDVYWSVETQVEEHLSAAKAALNGELEKTEKQKDGVRPSAEQKIPEDPSAPIPIVERKRRAESSKEVLYDFLKQLLVRKHLSISNMWT
jgi:THO complex subunit 2